MGFLPPCLVPPRRDGERSVALVVDYTGGENVSLRPCAIFLDASRTGTIGAVTTEYQPRRNIYVGGGSPCVRGTGGGRLHQV